MSAPSAPRTGRDCALLGIGANLAPQRLWPMLLHRRERLWTLADASGRRCRPTWSRLHSADELWRVTARPRAAGFFVAGGGRVGAAAADVPRPPMRRARRRRLTGRGPRSGIVARLLSTGEAPRDRPTVDSPAVGRCAPHRQQSGRDLAVVKPRRQGAPRRARGWRAGYHFRARNGTVPCWLRRSKRRLANGPCRWAGSRLERAWSQGVRRLESCISDSSRGTQAEVAATGEGLECADLRRVYPTRRERLKPKSQRNQHQRGLCPMSPWVDCCRAGRRTSGSYLRRAGLRAGCR